MNTEVSESKTQENEKNGSANILEFVDKLSERMPKRQGPAMSEADFLKFSDFIYYQCGIKLPPIKRTMLTVRLQKRLRVLGMNSFKEYFNYINSNKGRDKELVAMIDVVTTNKTNFFREAKHFDFLVNKAVPEILKGKGMSPLKRVNIWSAGCSSGEEPYTMSMVLADYFEKNPVGDYSILATDISTRVLDTAQKAIYSDDAVENINPQFKFKYLMRGKGGQAGFVRVIPELRSRIKFHRLNLNESTNFGIKMLMDIIFCRNVIIYFDRETQIKLFEKFYAQLEPGGFMFIGHSETLHGLNKNFIPVAVSVYRKPM